MKKSLSIIFCMSLLAAAPNVLAQATNTQPGQSEGGCQQIANDTHNYVNEIRQPGGALEQAQIISAEGADQANLLREGAQTGFDNAVDTNARLLMLRERLTGLTGSCEQACSQLEQELARQRDYNQQMASSTMMPASAQYQQMAQDFENRRGRAEQDLNSCRTAENEEGGQMDGQLGDLAQMLPALLAMMQAMGGADDPEAVETADNSCMGMAKQKIEAAQNGEDPAYIDAIEKTYNNLCNDSGVAIADLGSVGGATPNGSVTASRTGNLPDSRAVDQSFAGGLEKDGQSSKVESFGGSGGGFNGGSGSGGRAASLNGRRRGDPNKLNTDIMKGTSGGGIGGGRRGGGGAYAAGGPRSGRYGRTANADASKANLKQFLPGGKKYRGPASAAAKKGEVSGALGPSNFEKITRRYQKVQKSLLP